MRIGGEFIAGGTFIGLENLRSRNTGHLKQSLIISNANSKYTQNIMHFVNQFTP